MKRDMEKKRPLELYVHIPFCLRKCAYCDFLSGPADRETQNRYLEAILGEICALPSMEDREVPSIFIGGGTPTAVDAAGIGRILDRINKKFIISPDAEITIEANPGTLTQEKLFQYRKHGVNRLSLGLQSAHDGELKLLGRIHTWNQFLESYTLARDAGFTNINVDLMFALPEQTRESWNRTLRTVAELGPEHISAYSLILEEGTPFYEAELSFPDEDTEYRMYEDTAALLGAYGYRQYEISNYAREGFACRHNIGYWRRTDYLGLGLGAASLLDGERFSNTENMQEYLEGSSRPEALRRQRNRLTEKEKMEEFMFLGLRMTEGISAEEFSEQFGIPLEEVYGNVLRRYEKMGFLQEEKGFWRFTRAGIHVSNPILADFLLS